MTDKVDILSAKLGFEILVQKIRELESAVKDASWNSRKRISILEAENAELWRRLGEAEELFRTANTLKALVAELRRKLDEPCPVCVEQEEALKRADTESQEQEE